MKIEIWSDVACPWCYIGKRRFETALNSFEHKDQVQVHWRSFQLDPGLPEHYDGTELEYLSERKGMDPAQVSSMFGSVTAQAAAEGLRYDFDKVVVANSFAAHQLIHLAAAHDQADAVKERLLSAHFEEGEDIGSREFLIRTGVEHGIPAAEVTAALDTGQFAEDVRRDIAEARSLGISGVPFFVIDRKYGISGAQPAELFGQALAEAWREAHPLTLVGSNQAETCGPDGCAV
ncbi:MAG: disulfide bond formation protein DsbA [Micrococcaceae bacterium]|nr:disulfide bond formation protein DsbA [Micrococcaceae bacterium]